MNSYLGIHPYRFSALGAHVGGVRILNRKAQIENRSDRIWSAPQAAAQRVVRDQSGLPRLYIASSSVNVSRLGCAIVGTVVAGGIPCLWAASASVLVIALAGGAAAVLLGYWLVVSLCGAGVQYADVLESSLTPQDLSKSKLRPSLTVQKQGLPLPIENKPVLPVEALETWPENPGCIVALPSNDDQPTSGEKAMIATRGVMGSSHRNGNPWKMVYTVVGLHNFSEQEQEGSQFKQLHDWYANDLSHQIFVHLRYALLASLPGQAEAAIKAAWNFDWLCGYRQALEDTTQKNLAMSAVSLIVHNDFLLLASRGSCTVHLLDESGAQLVGGKEGRGKAGEGFSVPLQLHSKKLRTDKGPSVLKIDTEKWAGKTLLLAPPGVFAAACLQAGAERGQWIRDLFLSTQTKRKLSLKSAHADTTWGKMLLFPIE